MGCSPWGREESDTTERLHFHFSLSCTGEGNGNPLQCSCLENPRDGGAWWAAVDGVAQSWTRLKQPSSNTHYIYKVDKNLPYITGTTTQYSVMTYMGKEYKKRVDVCMCIQGGNSNPLQCSCSENPMDRGAWQATVRGVTKSWSQLCD